MPKTRLAGAMVLAFLMASSWVSAHAQIVAFGASNVSGANLAPNEAFPAQLEAMLHAKGYNVRVVNAGIYGNTTTEMRERMDTDIPPGTKIVILDMAGGVFNDHFKGISPQQGEADMAAIEARLKARGIAVIPMSGADLGPQYHQADHIHLSTEGHRFIASQLLPQVTQVLGRP